MLVAGILALIYPVVSSFAVIFALGCLLIISGIAQGISLIDAREVPHFWLQLVSVVLSGVRRCAFYSISRGRTFGADAPAARVLDG